MVASLAYACGTVADADVASAARFSWQGAVAVTHFATGRALRPGDFHSRALSTRMMDLFARNRGDWSAF